MVLKTSPMLASEKPIGPSNQYSIFSILKTKNQSVKIQGVKAISGKRFKLIFIVFI
jgi:hypothetical protein